MADSYEVFQMLHYEDDEMRSYINPDEHPLPPGRIKIRFRPERFRRPQNGK